MIYGKKIVIYEKKIVVYGKMLQNSGRKKVIPIKKISKLHLTNK